MYDIPELERKWLSYKVKKTLKPFLVTIAIVATAVVILLLIPSIDVFDTKIYEPAKSNTKKLIAADTSSEKKPIKNSSERTMKTETVPSAHNNIPTIKPKAKKPVKLEPSFNFMYGLEEEVLGYYDEPSKMKEQPHQKRQSTPPQPKIAEISEKNQKRTVTSRQIGIQQKQDSISRKKTTKNDTTAVKKVKKSSIEKLNINRKSDEKDIQDVIKRFKKNKNPALSLFVAKRFYAIGNYQQSYNYALITNELNSDIEDSWLIFAKSLVKLEQRDMAISTLESYIEDSRSIKAKLLLDSIKNGTMK